MNLSKFMFCTNCLTIFGIIMILLVEFNIKRFCSPIQMTQSNMKKCENKTCFYGKWVGRKSPLKPRCLFLNKTQCCRTKQKRYFVFHDDKLNKINPITEFMEILKKTSILMIGDSTMREFYEGIRELLKINGTTHNLTFILTYTISLKEAFQIYLSQ